MQRADTNITFEKTILSSTQPHGSLLVALESVSLNAIYKLGRQDETDGLGQV